MFCINRVGWAISGTRLKRILLINLILGTSIVLSRVASPRLTFYHRAINNALITLKHVRAASVLHDQRDMAESLLGQLC